MTTTTEFKTGDLVKSKATLRIENEFSFMGAIINAEITEVYLIDDGDKDHMIVRTSSGTYVRVRKNWFEKFNGE